MASDNANTPRILILESDRQFCASLRAFTVKGWPGASVQSLGVSLESMIEDTARLKSFDVLLVGCDFSRDGTAANPVLRAVRALAADPAAPPIILLSDSGSEYTAVQAVKSGAFDYIPKKHMSREQIVSTTKRALLAAEAISAGPTADQPIKLFGYDIRRCLASSDSVSVHVAFSAERAKEVVIKVLHRGRGSLSRDVDFERFVDEFKMLHDIDDPAVADIYDFRVTDQYCYIAMEYFPGGHLGKRLDGPLPVEKALAISVEIAHALAIIHAAGIVHRDLKPGNVMLREDGTAALIDFGISQSEAVDTSSAAQISGTPYYMSPEQARGEATDERTDLYALGVMLYQMLTGEKPFTGASRDDILEQHCSAPIPQLAEELSAYQHVVERLMAKSAAQRLANARELVELIGELQPPGAPSSDEPSGLPRPEDPSGEELADQVLSAGSV